MTTESQKNINMEVDEISLKELILKLQDWWRYLLSKWIIILSFGLLGGGIGFIYAYNKQITYTATTTFVLEDQKSNNLGGLSGLATIAGIDIGGGGAGIFQGDNIFELYKSRRIILQTLLTPVNISKKKQNLVERYIEINELKNNGIDDSAQSSIKFEADSVKEGKPFFKVNRIRDSILTKISDDISKNYLSVGKSNKTLAIIQVDVKSKDEIFAKTFNEAIVKNVNDFYVQTKTKRSLQNIRILEQKRDSVRSVMNGNIYSAAIVADATPNLNSARQVQRIVPIQKAQFSSETNKIILSNLVQNLELSKLSLMRETPLLEVIDHPVFPLLKTGSGKVKGLVVGGVLGGILICLILILRRLIRLIMI